MTKINTKTCEHRRLRFRDLDELLAEIDRIVAAEKAGTLRQTGNWTAGQIFGHLASWIEYSYNGYPLESHPPFFVRLAANMMKKMFLTKPMWRGMRLSRKPDHPGTYGIEELPTDEGARRLRAALARLQQREPARHHSPALGPLTDDQRIALNLRHAECHLGYLHP